jgi:Putative amidase domain
MFQIIPKSIKSLKLQVFFCSLLCLALVASSISIIGFSACKPNNEDDQNNERRAILSGLKNRSEIRAENQQKIRDVKNSSQDDISKAIKNKLVTNDLENNQVKITSFTKNNDITTGVAEIHTFFDYSDTDSGYAVQRYNFEYNTKTKELKTEIIITDFENKINLSSINEPSNEEKILIEKRKKSIPAEPNKTLESVKQDEITDVRQFATQIPVVNKSALCSTVKANAAGVYNKGAVASYAITYSPTNNYNPNYKNFYQSSLTGKGSDCANFSSQAMIAGGLQKDYGNNDSSGKDWNFDWLIWPLNGSNTLTWTAVPEQMNHFYNYENTGTWKLFKNSQTSVRKEVFNNQLYLGDYIYVDWTGDGIYDHVLIISGWVWDLGLQAWMPTVSSHTGDRSNISWNYFMQLAATQGYNDPQFAGIHHFSNIW